MLRHPTSEDWMECKRRALVTIGKIPISEPDEEWKEKILNARHSPIRYLQFSFLLEDIPSWVSVHLCRHIHAQPYVKSQRNDRQTVYDRNKAPQDSPVSMIWDLNAEELMVVANKRLCNQTAEKTKEIVQKICDLVKQSNPEFTKDLVPMCKYAGCHEMDPCNKKDEQFIPPFVVNPCVICGAETPEGNLVCGKCTREHERG